MRATPLREPLDAAVAPPRAALILRGEDRPFALIGAWAGGGALLGSEPVRVSGPGDDLFALLDELPALAPGDRAARPVVGGGWVGFLGFEARHRVERGHPPPPRPVPLPDGALSYYDHVLRMDAAGRWWFEALVTPEREEAIERRRDELAARLAAPPLAAAVLDARLALDAVAGGARRGRRGVPRAHPRPATCSRPTSACACRAGWTGDAFDLFAAAAEALPTDRAAFVAGPWGTVASLSPELFLMRTGRTVRSAPIKGTRPADRRAELAASAKDRAENVMIVDLVRNDLGRVCAPGSVRVSALAEVRPHAGVWHMVSEVEGELRDGVGDGALLRATFPPGSVTGAPKLAALDVIAELESTGREAYTGAIGFASPVAGLELSVAIRTFEVRGPRIWLGAGGGIVADSDGEDEAREAAAKAAPLLAAIGAQAPPPARRGAERAGPRTCAAGRGPCRDRIPAAGLYETLLVEDGRAARPRRPPGAARRQPAGAVPAAGAGRARRARRRRGARAPARPAADRRDPGRGRRGGGHAARRHPARRAAPGRRPRRPRTAQVARPHAARVPRGRRSGDAAAAARRRRRGARDEPDQRARRRGGRRALHAARRRPHPPGRHRRAQPARARARSRSPTCAPRRRSMSRARCAAAGARGCCPDGQRGDELGQ